MLARMAKYIPICHIAHVHSQEQLGLTRTTGPRCSVGTFDFFVLVAIFLYEGKMDSELGRINIEN